ncbi:MAG: tyrosine-type recombinase/integrase [Akkermansia sp.]
MLRIRRLIQLGADALKAEEASVSFAEAVEKCLAMKSHRSVRTVQDIRQTMNALMRCEKGLAERSVRGISSAEWSRILQKAYGHSPSRFVKARANLSGVYTVAYKQGWCAENPVKRIDVPELQERVIEPLPLESVEALMNTAQHPAHRDCLPAVALMLYAGVRPDELKRLSWLDIDWDEGELHLAARHSKTGGGRHIPLGRPLLALLKRVKMSGPICPKRWKECWQYLRQVAGFTHWVPDVLRHSYASYHAKMYRDLPRLQLAMGHRDCRLLLTRYINLRGISKRSAQVFWQARCLRTF